MFTSKTIATLFSGGGGVELGAIAAGLQPIWGVEHDPVTAEVYRANIGGHVIVQDVEAVNIKRLQRPDVLHASPPCQSHSQASWLNPHVRDDAEAGMSIIPYLEYLTPNVFTLENVIGWRHSDSAKAMEACLVSLGYQVHVSILNAADYGVPQTRERLFMIATRGRWVPPLPTPVPHAGWYSAVKDIRDTFKESTIPAWQRFANSRAWLTGTYPWAIDGKGLKSPNRQGYRKPTVRFGHQPWCTITH